MAPLRWIWGPPSPPGLRLLLAEPRSSEGGDGGVSLCLLLPPPAQAPASSLGAPGVCSVWVGILLVGAMSPVWDEGQGSRGHGLQARGVPK